MIRHSIVSLATAVLSISILASASSAGVELQAKPSARVQMPVVFEENRGQIDGPARFFSRGAGYTMFFAPQTLTMVVDKATGNAGQKIIRSSALRIVLENSNPDSDITGVNKLDGKTNYMIGNNPRLWRHGIANYRQVKYTDIYPDADVIFYGAGRQIEYDFVFRPGSDPARVRMALDGVIAVKEEPDGALALQTSAGDIRLSRPQMYQEGPGGRSTVAGRFLVQRIEGPDSQFSVSFEVGNYDRSKTLIVDPVVEYSSYFGGSDNDYAQAVSVDSLGNKYIAGSTRSLDFPRKGGTIQASCAGSFCEDSFVAKLDAAGTGLIYSTYLGGGRSDFATAVAVDADGNTYVAGATNSSDFPVTANARQKTCGGDCFTRDAFVAKLNSNGSALMFSTYLGGSDEDFATDIKVFQGSAVVAGFSGSGDFPVTAAAFQSQVGNGSSFVSRLNGDGSAFVFSTFIGEVSLQDAGPSLSIDAAGDLYLVGNTLSPYFPLTAGSFRTPFQTNLNSNLYLAKMNASGSALLYSARIGGAGITAGSKLDAAGNLYFGAASGTFFPVTAGAIEQQCSAGILVGKLSVDGSKLLASAHLCPERAWPTAAAFDKLGNLIVAGYTDSTEFTTTAGALQTAIRNGCCFSDVFITRLAPDASAITYSTYFGGNGSDYLNAMTVDSNDRLYLAGSTSSTNLTIRNGFQPIKGAFDDAFIAKIALPISKVSVYPAVLNFNSRGLGITGPPSLVTVVNNGTTPIPVASIVATGDFSVSSSCGSLLPANGRCSIAITFVPTLAGKRTGVLTIPVGTATQRVKLSGTGVNGALALPFQAPLQFGNQPLGTTSAPLPVTITNVGNTNLVISGISIDSGPTFNFSGSTTCFNPIAPNGSCTFQITFSAPGAFTANGLITVFDNSKQGTERIGVIGTGVSDAVAFASDGVRFNQQAKLSKSAVQKIAFTNGSASGISIASIKVSANFVQTHTCGATLAAGAVCYVNVAFKPQNTGILQGMVTIQDSGPGSPHILPLLGTGK